jgi:proteic killer suppression protein
MIASFGDKDTQALAEGRRVARWRAFERPARRKLYQFHLARRVADLAIPPGNRLEKLAGDRAGQWSVRINDQWRICFDWREDAAHEVEIVDYH